MFNECPKCGNESIIEWSEESMDVERSVKTGKVLKRSKTGSVIC